MITLDLKRLLDNRGVVNHHQYLVQNGFTRHTASNLLNNNKSGINYKHLEQLCILFNCTPNQLLKWTGTAKTPLDKNHPLNTLNHAPGKGNINSKLQQLPPDKLDELRNYLDNMDKEKKEQGNEK